MIVCCGDHFACIFASIWSIIQTLFHLGFCVWGTNFYECKYEIHNKTLHYFWYLTYFYTNSCMIPDLEGMYIQVERPRQIVLTEDGNSTAADNCNKKSVEVLEQLINNVKFPAESILASRTYLIFRIFIIIDAIWIITAVGLLIGTCYRFRFGMPMVFFFPWTLCLLIVLIFDAVVAGWCGFDVSNTYGLNNWFKSIGGTDQKGLEELAKNYPKISTSIPSILMTMIFSRFFVVWLVNLFLLYRIIKAGLNVAKNSKRSLEDQHSEDGVSRVKSTSQDLEADSTNPNSAAARIRRWQLYYGTTDDDDDEENEDRPSREVKRHHRRRSRQRASIEDEGWKKDNAFKYNQNLSVVGGYEGDRSNSPSPQPYPYSNSSGYESSQLSVPSDHDNIDNPGHHNRIIRQYEHQISITELRGQIPWSYFPENAAHAFKRNQNDAEDVDEEGTTNEGDCSIELNCKEETFVEVHFAN